MDDVGSVAAEEGAVERLQRRAALLQQGGAAAARLPRAHARSCPLACARRPAHPAHVYSALCPAVPLLLQDDEYEAQTEMEEDSDGPVVTTQVMDW